ncbi:unnamed protein product [Rotaria magnacalcarata]
MATILSLPVRQQQDSSKSNIVTSKFPKHFGVKTRINRMFKWCNKLRYMHMLILVFCTQLAVWLPLMTNPSTETIELSTNRFNISLARNEIYDRAYAKRCLSLPPSLLLSTSIDNIRSYSSMTIGLLLLLLNAIPLKIENTRSLATHPFNQLSMYSKSLSNGSIIIQFENRIIRLPNTSL